MGGTSTGSDSTTPSTVSVTDSTASFTGCVRLATVVVFSTAVAGAALGAGVDACGLFLAAENMTLSPSCAPRVRWCVRFGAVAGRVATMAAVG